MLVSLKRGFLNYPYLFEYLIFQVFVIRNDKRIRRTEALVLQVRFHLTHELIKVVLEIFLKIENFLISLVHFDLVYHFFMIID